MVVVLVTTNVMVQFRPAAEDAILKGAVKLEDNTENGVEPAADPTEHVVKQHEYEQVGEHVSLLMDAQQELGPTFEIWLEGHVQFKYMFV